MATKKDMKYTCTCNPAFVLFQRFSSVGKGGPSCKPSNRNLICLKTTFTHNSTIFTRIKTYLALKGKEVFAFFSLKSYTRVPKAGKEHGYKEKMNASMYNRAQTKERMVF